MQEKSLVKTTKKDINLQFKLLSAIGIFIIVSGHCYKGGLSLGYEWFPIYSFQLALFAFISGYFYKSRYEENAGSYIFKRVKRLVLPAYIWNIVYGVFIIIMSKFGYTIGAPVNLYNLFVMPFVDGEAFLYNLGSWFVYPLFVVCVFNVLFRKLLKVAKIYSEYIILAVYLAIGIFAIKSSINQAGNIYGVKLLLYRTMFFLPCFEFGHFYKIKLEKIDNLGSVAYFSILFAVQLILIACFDELNYTPSKCSGFVNGCIIPYVTAITGIAFWLRVSKLLTPVVGNWKFVRMVADNTYSIMIHHLLGFMCVKWMFYILSVITPAFSDFNVNLMKSSIWYYYIPDGKTQYALLYALAGIFVSILIKKICDIVVKKAKNLLQEKKPTHDNEVENKEKQVVMK